MEDRFNLSDCLIDDLRGCGALGILDSDIKKFIKEIKNLDENGDKSDDFMIIKKSKFNKIIGDRL